MVVSVVVEKVCDVFRSEGDSLLEFIRGVRG